MASRKQKKPRSSGGHTARAGSPFSDRDAEIVARAVRDLRGAGLQITAETVLAAARSRTSPLHRYFKWDDAVAAQLYRLQQARELLSMVKVYESLVDRPARAYYSVELHELPEGQQRQYHDRAVVLKFDAARDQVLARLYRTIAAAVAEAESLGAPRADAWWKNLVTLVRTSTPACSVVDGGDE